MRTLLVIEDEAPLRESIITILTIEGFEVIGASNGREGVELAREHSPDLIIADIMLPELDGYGVLRELRQRSSTATIPFIFLTARSNWDDMRRGMELGVVTVGPAGGIRKGGVDGGIGDAANAGELVSHDLGLEPQLRPIVDVLPLAAAASAGAKVGARRLDAVRRGLQDLDRAGEGVTALVLGDLDARYLAGQRVGDKDDAALVPAQRRAAVCDRCQ